MKQKIILLLTCVCLASCKQNDNLFKGEIRYVDSFKHECHLTGSVLNIDTIGTFQVDFIDTLLISTLYKSSNFARFYNANTLAYLGDLAYRGDAPNEFLSFSIMNQHQDSVLWVQDYIRKKMFEIDLLQSVKQISIVLNKTIDYQQVIDPLQAFYCNDTLLLIKEFDYEQGVRYIKFNPTSGSKPLAFIPMYNSILSQRDLNSIMSIADCLKPDCKQVASLTGVLNQIDILSLDGSVPNLSIKMGDGPGTLEEIRQNGDNLYDYYISLPRCNEYCIIALYCDKSKSNKEFHIINWNGEALFKLVTDEDLRDFNIDWKSGKLYGITVEDFVYVYDINNVLEKLN